MILEMAIADAYGFCFEFAPPDFVAQHNEGKTYIQHPGRSGNTPGNYSDDTQMAIALAEFLLSGKPLNTATLARFFVQTFKRDERAGYAGGFYKLLQSVKSGTELVQRIQPDSAKSGGAMRAAPCGLLSTVDEVCDVAMWQASVTHATRDGMNSAAAAALLVYACRNGCDQSYLPSFLNDTVPGYHWDIPWEGPVGAPGIHAVKAALTALVDAKTQTDLLKRCVAYTGDVDTVAAIAMAAGSFIPPWVLLADLHGDLCKGFENDPYGWSFLKKLDAALLKKFPLPKVDDEIVADEDPAIVPASDDDSILVLFGQ